MQRVVRLFPTMLLTFSLMAGCSSSGNKPQIPDEPLEVLYKQAQSKLNSGDYEKASQILEALDSRYPFGPYATQVQMQLIYAYYKNGDTAQTVANIDRFIRLNPTHKDIDYIYYMRGLANMQEDYNFFHDVFGMDRSERDPSYARQAFRDFQTIMKNFPQSIYASDARTRAVYLKNRLAKHDLAIANYYMKRQAWLSAANRAKYLIENYPDTEMTQSALEIMVHAYNKMGLADLAKHAQMMLTTNYPDSTILEQ